MIALRQIKKITNRIGREFHPDRIILFGSYAHGKPGKDSDVDLMVIMPFKGRPVKKSVEIRLKTRPPFPMDLLIRTQSMINKRIAMGDSFTRDILRKGKVLYESHNQGMG